MSQRPFSWGTTKVDHSIRTATGAPSLPSQSLPSHPGSPRSGPCSWGGSGWKPQIQMRHISQRFNPHNSPCPILFAFSCEKGGKAPNPNQPLHEASIPTNHGCSILALLRWERTNTNQRVVILNGARWGPCCALVRNGVSVVKDLLFVLRKASTPTTHPCPILLSERRSRKPALSEVEGDPLFGFWHQGWGNLAPHCPSFKCYGFA